MKVSASEPFQIIYSLYQHEYLGYLLESFVVRVDDAGKLTLQHQNISSKNAIEFKAGLDEKDFRIIEIIDEIQQDSIVRKFSTRVMKPDEFFLKTYDKEKGNKPIQEQITLYLEKRKAEILSLIHGKEVYEMGKDGEPAWKRLEVQGEKATVLFHFRRNEENTHYFPTIKFQKEKLEFQYKGAFLICDYPAWMVLEGKLITFEKNVDGKKIKPFLNKKFIVIPKNFEENYYSKFVAPLIESFDVYAKGFEIETHSARPEPVLKINSFQQATAMSLLPDAEVQESDDDRLVIELNFVYEGFRFKADKSGDVNVKLIKDGNDYTFHRINREIDKEKAVIKKLYDSGLQIKHGRAVLDKVVAFEWIKNNQDLIEEEEIELVQSKNTGKTYFLGKPKIEINITEEIDWFDIKAVIEFGNYKISFNQLRKYILSKNLEFTLPNGEIAVIPESWITEYSDLFALSEKVDGDDQEKIRKHHIALLEELRRSNLAILTMSNKLKKLHDFDQIDETPMPENFHGTLRPYQKAGYDWMSFLNEYRFGGCLADDMGLGKTVQTLSLLLDQKHKHEKVTSLLVLPTSLIYNWEKEAQKFTPELKVFCYTGTGRIKNTDYFSKYDVIITSYGIVRLDAEILSEFNFHYLILDESQAIKNPSSFISKAVRMLNGKNRLILTGTPLENSTMDLWSQMDFVNPGLLGSRSYFRNEFLIPIEKKGNEKKIKRLNAIIKPFIMRREKSQVAKELPEKIENVTYSSMTPEQEKIYEDVKAAYRNEILEQVESGTLKKNQLLLIQGLTKLRQIANHPFLIDPDYAHDSGKMEDVCEMIETTIQKKHKILIFSQFVKHLKIFAEYFEKRKFDYAYLDGSTKNRMEEVERFQSDPDLKLFLISLKAGGLGLNLTKADYVFILDPWWNPAAEQQAIDRSHRIGQENKVFAYKFITKNSVEEKILQLQQKKLKLSRELIKTEESFVKSLTSDDILNLLS